MCKHVAATLYGVGARLDEDPMLFFKLRKAQVDQLISEAIQNKKKKLLKKSKVKSSKVIDKSKISSIFGLEMDDYKVKKKKRVKKTTAKTNM